MPPAFRQDPALTRQVGLVDLIFAAIIAFVIFPTLAFAVGYVVMMRWADGIVAIPGAMLAAIGYTGLLAWVASPVAVGVGWWATRTGRTGWVTALACGAVAGTACSLIAIGGVDLRMIGSEALGVVGAFALAGAIYGSVALIALRWLRADLFKAEA